MAKNNPFAQNAGLQKIAEQKPLENILEIADSLSQLGLNMSLLGSTHYVLERLNSMSPAEVEYSKELFVKNKHPRFKEFAGSRGMPYGKTSAYVECIRKADTQKIAKLIKIVGMLIQKKCICSGKKEKRSSSLPLSIDS